MLRVKPEQSECVLVRPVLKPKLFEGQVEAKVRFARAGKGVTYRRCLEDPTALSVCHCQRKTAIQNEVKTALAQDLIQHRDNSAAVGASQRRYSTAQQLHT